MKKETKYPKYIIDLARKLRQKMTIPELILWENIKNRQVDGHKFRRQHPIYRYILNFYCHEKRLAIEVDGETHSERKVYDKFRDKYLESINIKTLRIKNRDIIENLDKVIEVIQKEINFLK
jgi:very-short-patch-repair endonuclease